MRLHFLMILALPILAGSPAYLAWLDQQVQSG